ncbi:E3 ubiquitin-protein ligase [Acrasis kona]|uniref:E3 ubiquitin-protein ligase n=1 Tax=Acrasis kona TaxID=1008807 RepID=A0AAW2ZL61_9EUKA
MNNKKPKRMVLTKGTEEEKLLDDTNTPPTPLVPTNKKRVRNSSPQCPEEEVDKPQRKRRRITKKAAHQDTPPTVQEPVAAEPIVHDECSVCYENILDQGLLDCCQHSFCKDCITTWSKESNACPVCKQRFSTIKNKSIESGVISEVQHIPERNYTHQVESLPIHLPLLWFLRDVIYEVQNNSSSLDDPVFERMINFRFAFRIMRTERDSESEQ